MVVVVFHGKLELVVVEFREREKHVKLVQGSFKGFEFESWLLLLIIFLDSPTLEQGSF